jgi:hypothetical protein
VLALFVALSGTAVAAGIVPLARRALVADNARKLNGQTLNQIAGAFGAAVPQLVNVRTSAWSLSPGAGQDFATACAAGEKAIAGGYDNPSGDALAFDTRPGAEGASWRVFLVNLSGTAGASGSIYAICIA